MARTSVFIAGSARRVLKRSGVRRRVSRGIGQVLNGKDVGGMPES